MIRYMNLNDEKGTDPTVEAIVEMFPEDFLRDTARESGFVIREPKLIRLFFSGC